MRKYKGHEIHKIIHKDKKTVDQPLKNSSGTLTENGKFFQAANEYKEEKASNGLENFQLEEDAPELFDSENLDSENNDQEFSSFVKEQNEDEDELEIPAFLRRQKN